MWKEHFNLKQSNHLSIVGNESYNLFDQRKITSNLQRLLAFGRLSYQHVTGERALLSASKLF